ncbi:MAG: sensor histidine kinase [Clostridia bacterium]|nr:sensor histidine kinase [Clostridia bacterium]
MKLLSRKLFRMETRSLFLAVLLPVFILGLLTGVLNVRTLRREIEYSFDSRARLVSNHLSSITQTVQSLYYSLSRSPMVTPSLKDAVVQASQGQLSAEERDTLNVLLELIFDSCRKNPYVDSGCIYFDDGGDCYLSSTEYLARLSESTDTGWFESYRQASPDLSVWTENRTLPQADGSGKKVLAIYSRIYVENDPDKSCGILILNIDCEPLESILERGYTQYETVAMITAESGRILFRSPSADAALPVSLSELGPFIHTRFEDTWQQDSSGLRKMQLGTDGFLCMIQRLSRFGWHLVLLTPPEKLYAPVNRMILLLIFMIFLTLLCGVTFAAYTAHQKMRDIARVRDSIQRAKDGQSTVALPGRVSVYSQTLREIIDTFLDKDYLTIQLSERQHYAQVLELKALQSQLNPHFLFNTLTTIQWKAIALTGGQNDASNMIEYLSDILRYSLDDSSRMSTVREELAMLDSYIAIQRIRYGDRLRYSCSCAPEVTDQYVIRMLLQPLVENSIHHGMSENRACLTVLVEIAKEQGRLLIRVTDDGKGIESAKLQEIRDALANPSEEHGGHIGLYNVSKRMMLTYGGNIPHIRSTPGEGTVITLRLPLLDADPFAGDRNNLPSSETNPD